MKRLRVLPALGTLVGVAMLAGGCARLGGDVQAGGGPLQASGVVETVELQVASEIGGTVTAVNLAEGQRVEAGQVLVVLDSRLLMAQRQQAQAALATAQANYELVEAATALAEKQQAAAVAAARLELTSAEQALAELYDTAGLQAAQAQRELAAARDALDSAEYDWQVQQEGYRASGDSINAAEANLVLAENEVDRAQKEFNRYSGRKEDDPQRALALSNLSAARQKRDAVLRQLNWMKGNPSDIDQAMLDADVAFAQARAAEAQRQWQALLAGPDPQDVALLEERIAAAQARLAAASAEQTGAQQLAVAQAQIDTALANLAVLDVQLEKTTLRAPAGGVILARNLEPGETVNPGSTALVIGQLDAPTITVYVPEDRYGQIQLGQSAAVTADSFPGQTFEGTVIHIADQAEFTPRNVQTEQGRRATVFAVNLRVADPQGLLKPGMPADVAFQ